MIRSGTSQLVSRRHRRRVRGGGAATRRTSSCSRELGIRSFICVPVQARGRTLGAITLVAGRVGPALRRGRPADAEELALRVGVGRRERAALRGGRAPRARGARARDDRRRRRAPRQRRARAALEPRRRGDHRHRRAPTSSAARRARSLPGYDDNVAAVDVDGRPQTVPVEIDGRELWLSFSAVRFDEGTVYAFRDLTEERALEQMRSDFVATVSHELRTPLAAIYGAAITLRRADLDLGEEMRGRLLDVVAEESDRLAADRQRRAAREPPRLGPAAAEHRDDRRRPPDRERRRVGADSPAGVREPVGADREAAAAGRGRRAAAAPGARQPRRERRQVLARRRPGDGAARRATTAACAGR